MVEKAKKQENNVKSRRILAYFEEKRLKKGEYLSVFTLKNGSRRACIRDKYGKAFIILPDTVKL